MSIRKLATIILAATLLFTGCSKTNEPVGFDYQEAVAVITAYEDAYRDYVQNGDGEVALSTATSQTPNGAPCNVRFTNIIGQPFTSCSLEVERNNRIEYDEYFAISDTMMMAVRTYIDDSGRAIITKYISDSGNMYLVNDDTQTCDLIEDIEALDFFVTFDQVTNAYAGGALE